MIPQAGHQRPRSASLLLLGPSAEECFFLSKESVYSETALLGKACEDVLAISPIKIGKEISVTCVNHCGQHPLVELSGDCSPLRGFREKLSDESSLHS